MQRNHCLLDLFAEQFVKEIKTRKIQNIDTALNTNTGIVPMFAEQLFKEIETKKAAGGIEFEVKLSMLEIYNEVGTLVQCDKNVFLFFLTLSFVKFIIPCASCEILSSLLAPQSGALRISAYRDFQPIPNPLIAFEQLSLSMVI